MSARNISQENSLLVKLRERFEEALLQFPSTEVLFLVGPSAAFPAEFLCMGFLDADAPNFRWPMIKPSNQVPIDTRSVFLGDCRTELLAFFGELDSLDTARRLYKVAIGNVAEYQTPDGHKTTECDYPHFAWARWLIDHRCDDTKRSLVAWHSQQRNVTGSQKLDGTGRLDISPRPTPKKLVAKGFSEWCCVAVTLSFFDVAAKVLKPGNYKGDVKRSTVRGEGRAKLIAALTKHHKYADGSCLNLNFIENNELARLAEVAKSTASAFFKAYFKGWDKYRAICNRSDAKTLVAALKLMNDEFRPYHLFGTEPPNEADHDDEE